MLFLIGVVALIAPVIVLPTQATASTECPVWKQLAGACMTNTGTEIIIDGSQETGGDPGSSPIDVGWQPPTDDSWSPQKPFDFDQCLIDWDSYIHCFRASEEAEETTEEDDAPAIPAVTISDLVRFAPAGSVIHGEPDDVGVVGLPTNFVAAASVHTVDASLFGFPISVRFTPSAYDFSFGDGATLTASSGGATWESLGQAQFTPTDTGHTYTERGTYTARVDVRYTAEVDLGVGWFPVDGEVTAPGPARDIRIFQAHTALVAYTCAQAPTSPGC